MSEVKRFDFDIDEAGANIRFVELVDGGYTLFTDFDAQRLRADTAEAELEVVRQSRDDELENYNTLISELAAAEQRIAKFEDLLKDMRALPQKRCAAFIVQIIDVLDGPRAALNPNPNPKGVCHNHNYHLGECTKCGAISATE